MIQTPGKRRVKPFVGAVNIEAELGKKFAGRYWNRVSHCARSGPCVQYGNWYIVSSPHGTGLIGRSVAAPLEKMEGAVDDMSLIALALSSLSCFVFGATLLLTVGGKMIAVDTFSGEVAVVACLSDEDTSHPTHIGHGDDGDHGGDDDGDGGAAMSERSGNSAGILGGNGAVSTTARTSDSDGGSIHKGKGQGKRPLSQYTKGVIMTSSHVCAADQVSSIVGNLLRTLVVDLMVGALATWRGKSCRVTLGDMSGVCEARGHAATLFSTFNKSYLRLIVPKEQDEGHAVASIHCFVRDCGHDNGHGLRGGPLTARNGSGAAGSILGGDGGDADRAHGSGRNSRASRRTPLRSGESSSTIGGGSASHLRRRSRAARRPATSPKMTAKKHTSGPRDVVLMLCNDDTSLDELHEIKSSLSALQRAYPDSF